ncbi:glycoside hydrolase family 78 protein [Cadophora sp. MPI-SDFR-AT-0126]|nr:glycoside hydrolase family 78 protein [Leotiomycetes sp. MPI-SDFR-AT-0126]
MGNLSITKITFEHYPDGFGIGHSAPRLSWRFSSEARDWKQIAVELKILINPGATSESLNTFRIETSDSALVPWPAQPLRSRDIAEVSVRAIGERLSTPWSAPTTVEVALLNRSDWAAGLIESAVPQSIDATKRPVVFQKEFLVESVEKSRLYITAHGIYEAKINGKKVGNHVLAPGWTSYNHRLNYQVHDVQSLLVKGTNTLVVEVGEGWYAGRLGFMGGVRSIYGEQVGLLAQLEVDGSVLCKTDASWTCGTGSILESEIYDGEIVDYREELRTSHSVVVKDLDENVILAAPEIPPVRCIEDISPVSISKSPSGKVIVDFGQNLVGWVRVNLKSFGPDCAGKMIRLSHVEVLENGECGSRPLRLAKAQDSITLSAQLPEEYWEPKFTFHGFRYVQVDGWPTENAMPTTDDFTARVIHTDMEQTGWFECADTMVNKLHSNVRWGMRGNFVSVPTDCPQRDERMGWTGDLGVFAGTANFLYDTHGMLGNWLADLAAEQFEQDGVLPPPVVPDVMQFAGPRQPLAVWSDVTVTAPWDIYQNFGDISILQQQYESMTAWIDRGLPRGPNRLWSKTAHQLGDWLDPSAPPQDPGKALTDSQLVANAYLVHLTGLLAKISTILGHQEQAAMYHRDFEELRVTFQDEYITPNGRLASDSQTAYALVICFDLCANEKHKEGCGDRLEFLVRSNGFKVATGFVGTPLICRALSISGRDFLAYRMILEKKCPSWLYAVTMGSTTMWERWDSMLPDGSLNPGDMLSFNHYAFGAIAQWLHEVVGGISAQEPGWKKILVRPVPGGIITSASIKHLSAYGMIECHWTIESGKTFNVEVFVPPNTTAIVVLPGQIESQGVEVGSGRHEFCIEYNSDTRWPPKPITPPPPFYHAEPDEFAG